MTERVERYRLVSVVAGRMKSMCAVAVVGLAAACSDPGAAFEFPPTDVVFEGDLIRIRAAPGFEPCAGAGPSMEAMLSFLIDDTGLGGLDEPIEVYWLEEDDVQDICTVDYHVVGCSLSTTEAVTTRIPEEHEVVHAYFQRKALDTFRYSFFEEGIATVYGTETRAPAPRTTLDESIVFDRRMRGEHYPRAGHFVSFLIEEFGPQTTAAFVAQSSFTTPESLSADFEAHFGESLERAIETYSEVPESCTGSGWQRFSACEQHPVGWIGPLTWEVGVGAACESDSSRGAAGGAALERFVYETSEDVVVELRGADIVELRPEVELLRCGGGCDAEFSFSHDLEDGRLFGLPLDAGQYLVTSTFEGGSVIEPSRVVITRDR